MNGHARVSRFLFFVLFAPFLISSGGLVCQERTGETRLLSLELEALGENWITFDPALRVYNVWLPPLAAAGTIRAESMDEDARVTWYVPDGAGMLASGIVGMGGGEVTVDLPPDGYSLYVGVFPPGGDIDTYIVNFNPNCPLGDACSNGGGPLGMCQANACITRGTGLANQGPVIEIDSPAPGEVLVAPPTRVVGEVSHVHPIESVVINGIEQDVSQQIFTPGDVNTTADQYTLAIDTTIPQTDMARDIAGLTTGVGTFDPGSNRLIVSATDDRGNRSFRKHIFAVGEVTPLGTASGAEEGEVSVLSGIENALVLGASPTTLDFAVQSACTELTVLLNEWMRGTPPLTCNGGAKDGDPCKANKDCGSCTPQTVCNGGDSDGVACTDAEQCPGGSCTQPPGVCNGGDKDGVLCAANEDCGSCTQTQLCSGECVPSSCTVPMVCNGGDKDGVLCAANEDCGSCTPQTVCSGGERNRKPCGSDAECPDASCGVRVCSGGDNVGVGCDADAECPGGSCTYSRFSYSNQLGFNTALVCDPEINYYLNFIELGSLACNATFTEGLFTLEVQPELRAFEIAARGECGICINVGDVGLESIAVGVNLGLSVYLPPIRVSLRDWQNMEPIEAPSCDGGERDGMECSFDEECPGPPGTASCKRSAIERFFADSLTTPAVERARVDGAVIINSLRDPRFPLLRAQIDERLLTLVVQDEGLRGEIASLLNDEPYERAVLFLRDWLAGMLTDLAAIEVNKELESKSCDGGGVECTIDADCGRCLANACSAGEKVCSIGENAGNICEDDPDCGSCVANVDPVDRIGDEFALDSFTTTHDGLTITVKGKFSPALIDPELEVAPAGLRTPADAPTVAPGGEDTFFAISDDAFNQIFATMTALGDLKGACLPSPEGSPKTMGDYCQELIAISPTSVGTGVCVGIQGGDCEGLATPADQGLCHGVRGDNCNTIPIFNGSIPGIPVPGVPDLGALEREACRNVPIQNISADMPLLYCVQADVPPSFWIQDDGTTPDRVETQVRLNDLLIAVVVDRQSDQTGDGLSGLPDCGDKEADQTGACRLVANCLDLNLLTDVVLKSTADESEMSVEVQGVQRLERPAGTVCGGGVNFGANDPLGIQDNFGEVVDGLIGKINSKVPSLLPALPLPLTDLRMVALETTQAEPGFQDYLGITSSGLPPCGDGTCDPGERCGYSRADSCVQDCNLCEAGELCVLDKDCDTGLCAGGVCRVVPRLDVTVGVSDSSCLRENGEICFRDPACESGNCLAFQCAACKPNGEEYGCIDDDTCCSNICRAASCSARVGNGELCARDEVCQSDICRPSPVVPRCSARVPNGSVCLRDKVCQSGRCRFGFCVCPLGIFGSVCTSNSQCCSGYCRPIRWLADRCGL